MLRHIAIVIGLVIRFTTLCALCLSGCGAVKAAQTPSKVPPRAHVASAAPAEDDSASERISTTQAPRIDKKVRREDHRPARPVAPTAAPVTEAPSLPTDVLDHVYFKENDSDLDDDHDILDAFADLAGDDSLRLVLIAHADARESEPLRISTRRAETVKGYLLARGVPENRVHVRVVGSRAPLPTSATGTDDGAENRCVQLAVEKHGQ